MCFCDSLVWWDREAWHALEMQRERLFLVGMAELGVQEEGRVRKSILQRVH